VDDRRISDHWNTNTTVNLALRLGSVRRPRIDASTGLIIGGALAALAYLSWPLGYLVNRAVVSGGLASDLEVPGQRFYWLFIGLDITSGALMLGLSVVAWHRGRQRRTVGTAAWIIGYGAFGLSSVISAGVPLSCGSGRAALLACGTVADTYGFHDAISVLGYVAFFVALMTAVRRAWPDRLTRPLAAATVATGVLWTAAGLTFLALTLAQLPEVTAQHFLLLLTSAAIFLVPANLLVDGRVRNRAWAGQESDDPPGRSADPHPSGRGSATTPAGRR
jgi:hypothetical protein